MTAGRKVGHIVTQETRDRISKSCKGKKPWCTGKKLSEEHKKKLSLAKIGRKLSEETKEKIRLSSIGNKSRTGKTNSEEHKMAVRKNRIGKKASKETREKIVNLRKGKKSTWWKGGITPINLQIRKSLEYRLWREEVFKRDNWTCVICKQKGGKLNADHIKPFSLYKELRFEITNGRTLCEKCHRETDTFGTKIRKYKQ